MQLSGNILDYCVVFGAGVLVSFTPCVYPVMPITAGLIAGFNTRGTRWMGLTLSLIYVFGLALTYCGLAAVAALTGKIFGQFQNHPLVYFGVANILLFFALAMFDVITLPAFGAQLNYKIQKKGLLAVLFFGMTAGLVIGPCTAPVLGTLYLYIAGKQNLLHGLSLMFVFSYGVGASLILIGTFSGLLARLPKSGQWLLRVKQLGGLILLLTAEYFLIEAGKLWIQM